MKTIADKNSPVWPGRGDPGFGSGTAGETVPSIGLFHCRNAGQHDGFRPILEAALYLVPCRYVVLQWFDARRRRISMRSGAGLPEDYMEDGPLAGRIGYDTLVHSRRKTVARHNLQRTRFVVTDPEVRRYGLSSYAGAAVCVNDRVVGCLAVFDDRPQRYNTGHRKILEMMAGVAALIEDHHLVEARLNKKINNDKLITAISAKAISNPPQHFLPYCLKKIALWSGACGAVLFWMDHRTGQLQTGFEYWRDRISPAGPAMKMPSLQTLPAVREVIEKGQPLYWTGSAVLDSAGLGDLFQQNELMAVFFLPLRTGRQTVGICCLCFVDDTGRRKKEDMAVLMTVLRIVAQWREARSISRELYESQALNNQMLQLSPTAIYHLDFEKNRFIGVNDYLCHYTGYSEEELLNMNPVDLLTAESEQAYRIRMGDFLAGRPVPDNVEYQIRTKDGHLEWARIHTRFIYKDGKIVSAIVVAHNVTEQKKVMAELSEYRKKLEALVEERTHALLEANKKLQAEIAIRTSTAKQLKAKSERLKDLNTAMGVLLDKRNEDQLVAQEHIRVNLRQLVEPYLERLAASGLNPIQKQLLELIRMNLSEVVDAPLADVSEKYYIFSPGELQVANLIRNGKTTKEIARLLRVSSRTVESYRNSIRKKLGLQNRRVNLRTYLSAKE